MNTQTDLIEIYEITQIKGGFHAEFAYIDQRDDNATPMFIPMAKLVDYVEQKGLNQYYHNEITGECRTIPVYIYIANEWKDVVASYLHEAAEMAERRLMA